MKKFGLNPLQSVSLPGYSNDCWLTTSSVSLYTEQDKQLPDDFIDAKRCGCC